MEKLPRARTSEMVVQNFANETLIYDQNTHRAYCLNETISHVYHACDGTQTFDELKKRRKFSDELIYLALSELKNKNLLIDESPSRFDGLSRREIIKRAALTSMVALPVISALVAPTAAMAQSAAACGGTNPAGVIVSCANSANDCGTNINGANTCQSCTTAFSNSPSNCTANGFPGACACT